MTMSKYKRSKEGNQKSSKKWQLNINGKTQRPFDHCKFMRRRIALQLLYFGHGYSGMQAQLHMPDTIEQNLITALLVTKLIPSAEDANLVCAGRTDAGVSAFKQVISVNVRSALKEADGLFLPPNYVGEACCSTSQSTVSTNSPLSELDYQKMLNAVLPVSIRVLAWAAVAPEFSARFNCNRRTYKYWFPKSQLNIQRMNEACDLLIGEHDFRNFCRPAPAQTSTFVRKIDKAVIYVTEIVQQHFGDSYSICQLTIQASGFLWHQIRCVMQLLFLIGEDKEQPSLIGQLLNVDECPNRPQYALADPAPLCLYECAYGEDDSSGANLQWQSSSANRVTLLKQVNAQWTMMAIKTAMMRSMLSDLNREWPTETSNAALQLHSCLHKEKSHPHRLLMSRETIDFEAVVNQAEKKKSRKRLQKPKQQPAERNEVDDVQQLAILAPNGDKLPQNAFKRFKIDNSDPM